MTTQPTNSTARARAAIGKLRIMAADDWGLSGEDAKACGEAADRMEEMLNDAPVAPDGDAAKWEAAYCIERDKSVAAQKRITRLLVAMAGAVKLLSRRPIGATLSWAMERSVTILQEGARESAAAKAEVRP